MRAYYNEIDPFCVRVLKARIADGSLPPGDVDDRDIRTVEPGDLGDYAQIHLFAGIGGFPLACRLAEWGDERPLWTGGFPCQPFSNAGRKNGASDDRYLWPEIARLLPAAQDGPPWCLFENVDGITDMALDRVLFDLEALGYASRSYWLPACAVDAPHKRMRTWIVANGSGQRRQQDAGSASSDENSNGRWSESDHVFAGSGENEHVGNGQRQGPQIGSQPKDERGFIRGEGPAALPADPRGYWASHSWIVGGDGKARRVPEPGVRLLAHGVSERVARLRALGNAIVPQVAAEILKAMRCTSR